MTRAFHAQRIMLKSTENNNLKPVLIIGTGNDFRSDDAAGLITARELKAAIGRYADIAESDGDGTKIMEMWKDYDKVIIIDAVSFNSKPGTVHVLDAAAVKFPKESTAHSSHLFSVADAVETAKAMGTLPERVLIYGVEGKSFEMGTGVSDEVRKGIGEIKNLIQKEILI